MTARGLPPTPENYVREYCNAAGLPLASCQMQEAGSPDPETMHQIERIIAQVSVTSADLATGVDRFHVDTGPLLADLGTTPTKEAFACLLQEFTRSTSTLQLTIDASHRELGKSAASSTRPTANSSAPRNWRTPIP